MSNGPQAAYHFLPWVRYGVAKDIKSPAYPAYGRKPIADPPSRAPAPITLLLTGEISNEIMIPLHLHGPGDVMGVDPREILRAEPRHLTMDFPPHLFPFIEFERPDFPWLFTPAAPDSDECLRPWIVLVAVHKEEAQFAPGNPLPILTCKATELPNLEESWAWAHAQYVGGVSESLNDLSTKPHQNVSRLLCPRKLTERQVYYACLVPAFEVGRKAGLGKKFTPEDERLKASWSMADASVELPVYYHWEFGTGDAGSFEDLVDRLTVLKELPAGTRLMDVSRTGAGMPQYPGATLGVASALTPPDNPPADWPPNLPQNFESFKNSLQAVLEPREGQAPAIQQGVTPPLYGRWHVKAAANGAGPTAGRLLEPGTAPPWLRDLNRDPRHRVAAALGAQVVQNQQELLVAAAWEQVAQLQAVNQYYRRKQFAREVTASIHEKRLQRLSEDAFWQIMQPLVRPPEETPASEGPARLSASGALAPEAPKTGRPERALLEAIVSAPFRRIARGRGRLARRGTVANTEADVGELRSVSATPSFGPNDLLERVRSRLIQVAPPPGVFAAPLGNAARPHSPEAAPPPPESLPAPLADSGGRETLMEVLRPDATFTQEAQNRLDLPPEMAVIWTRPDALEPVSVSPAFPQPMYEPLRELFPEMLLPGLDKVPHNSLALLETNAAFIEAYMVGLNHELSRELLWREFPTDLRGTYFRQFWDVRGSLAERETLMDIPDIKDWQNPLGGNMPAERGSNLFMLLIRGDLLLRYPNAIIYVSRALGSEERPVYDENSQPNFPVLRISLAPGVALLGFALRPSPISAPPADPGWFFVIEEHPTETRFGLDISQKPLTSWRELTWNDVKLSNGHISPQEPMAQPASQDRKNVSWGKNGAHMAYITLRKPYRLKVHSRVWCGNGFEKRAKIKEGKVVP